MHRGGSGCVFRTGVPVQESLAAEHGRELLADALEHLLDGGGVAHESGRHLEALGRDVTDGRLDVVGDPLYKVRRVLVLHVQHLLVHLRITQAPTHMFRAPASVWLLRPLTQQEWRRITGVQPFPGRSTQAALC